MSVITKLLQIIRFQKSILVHAIVILGATARDDIKFIKGNEKLRRLDGYVAPFHQPSAEKDTRPVCVALPQLKTELVGSDHSHVCGVACDISVANSHLKVHEISVKLEPFHNHDASNFCD